MRKLLLFLVLTVLVGLFATFQGNRTAHEYDRKNAAQIQQDILQLDKEVLQELRSIYKSDIGIQNLRDKWSTKGIGFVIYNRGVIADWSTNGIPFANEFDARQPPQQGIVKLRNAWYLCRSLQDGDQLLVGYALLRTDHDFENRYIANRWGAGLNTDARCSFTQANADVNLTLSDGPSTFGLRFLPPKTETALSWTALVWFLFLLFLSATLWHTAKWLQQISSRSTGLMVFVVLMAGIRALMQWLEIPRGIYTLELFGPTPHATSVFIPSLGDLLLHLLFLGIVLLQLARIPLKIGHRHLQKWVTIGFPVLLIWPVHYLFEALVVNSSFSLDLNSPFSLGIYSFVGLVVSFFILLNYYILFQWLYGSLDVAFRTFRQTVFPLVVAVLMLILLLGADVHAVVVGAAAGVVLQSLMLIQNWVKDKNGIYRHVPSVIAFSVLASIMLMGEITENEHQLRVGIAGKIDQQQDPITEYLFTDLAADIRSDRKLRLALTDSPLNSGKVLQLLHSKLSYDHWNRYRGVVDIYNMNGGIMVSDREMKGPNYSELQQEYTDVRPTISEGLRYVGNWNDGGGYLARIVVDGQRNQNSLVIFIRLVPEKTDDILGFTDLFVAEEIGTAKQLEGYSYALYHQGELKEEHGDFAYSLSDRQYEAYDAETCFFHSDGYSHLVARPQEDTVVVVSRVAPGLLGYLTTFSYLFFLYLVGAMFISLLSGQLIAALRGRRSFRNRINLAMSAVSFTSLLLVGLLTVYYVVREYNGRNQEMISEKSRSVLMELEQKLRDKQRIGKEDEPMLSALLLKFSNVFFTDINLYDLDGKLLATSRPRLFDEGLMAQVMDPTAFTEMRFAQRSSFIQQETIGNLNYLTAYVPFRNGNKQVVAFMSLPYFARQYGLQQEIFSLLAALINIYVLLVLISVVLALLVSDRITEPLRFIRESLKDLKLDQTNRAIEWNSRDEIGELVDEYNRTLNELVVSAELLARSERESAWREMAKQVAHEIKNPLTPMKLSIQMLQRSKNDGVDDLGERIERTTKTLIEQIDTLSNIATEFSSFAQMPKPTIARVELKELLQGIVQLYRGTDVEITLSLETATDAVVKADREQLLRVFNNLIKNGIQAVEDGVKAKLDMRLFAEEDQWAVTLKDNGPGIPEELRERIFTPNFTTKSSGMGLGLAMVKNIVESVDGKISFVSENAIGTTFYLTFPKAERIDDKGEE